MIEALKDMVTIWKMELGWWRRHWIVGIIWSIIYAFGVGLYVNWKFDLIELPKLKLKKF